MLVNFFLQLGTGSHSPQHCHSYRSTHKKTMQATLKFNVIYLYCLYFWCRNMTRRVLTLPPPNNVLFVQKIATSTKLTKWWTGYNIKPTRIKWQWQQQLETRQCWCGWMNGLYKLGDGGCHWAVMPVHYVSWWVIFVEKLILTRVEVLSSWYLVRQQSGCCLFH